MLSSRWFNLSGGLRIAHVFSVALAVGAMLAYTAFASASIIVRDTWQDGTDSDPAAPVYSENGTDSEPDGDIESAWFQGGTGSLDPVGPGGPLHGDVDATSTSSSASWTTYFTPEVAPVTLASAGDKLCLTWVFTTGDVTATNASQNLRIGVVNTPGLSRITEDGTPGGGLYTGYGVFGNMAETIGHNSAFQLKDRIANSALLSASGDWGTVAGQTSNAPTAASGTSGYQDDTEYTFMMMITRLANGNLDIEASMVGEAGSTLNGGNNFFTSVSDVAPNGGSYSFDTFALRPSSAASTASDFYTSLFQVEYKQIPEPASFALLGLGSLALLMWRRRS